MLYLTPFITLYGCAVAALLGACMGSFLNCMAGRIVRGAPTLGGRSHCDACGHVLGIGELIPVVSYLRGRGRCRHCGEKLSVRYLLSELTGAAVFVSILLKYDISLQTLEWWAFAAILLCAAFADLEGYIIPDRLIMAGAVLFCLCLGLAENVAARALDGLVGGFAVAGAVLATVLLAERRMKKEAMGGGDLKLLFVTGLMLGWQKNLLCLILACVIGILWGVAARRRDQPIPWGPGIALAAWAVVLWGDVAIAGYLGLFC